MHHLILLRKSSSTSTRMNEMLLDMFHQRRSLVVTSTWNTRLSCTPNVKIYWCQCSVSDTVLAHGHIETDLWHQGTLRIVVAHRLQRTLHRPMAHTERSGTYSRLILPQILAWFSCNIVQKERWDVRRAQGERIWTFHWRWPIVETTETSSIGKGTYLLGRRTIL